MKSWTNISLDDLERVGVEVKRLLQTPAVVILSGEVGAGKTTFVKNFAGEHDICSPTYSLITEYDDLVHADLYRIEDPNELIHLELELYLDGKDYFFIEWGGDYRDALYSLLGDEFTYYELSIEILDEGNSRLFSLKRMD